MDVLVTDAIQRAYVIATGKTTVLAQTDPKFLRLLAIADTKTKDWSGEQGTDWMSLYDIFDLGSVTATDTFDSDDEIRKLSQREGDSAIVTATNGNFYKYDIVNPDKLQQYKYRNACALIPYNGEIVFARAFGSTDPQIGGDLTVPGYHFVDDIDIDSINEDQTVQVDDPNWLIYMIAAEYVRNDKVRQNQYGNLIALANESMLSMKADNGDQRQEIPIDMDFSDIDPNTSGAFN